MGASLQFQVWFQSENDEAVNQVKAKSLQIVPSERSDSTDHVKPGGHFALGYRFECHEPSLYLVIAWLATRIFLLKVQSIILNEASSSFFFALLSEVVIMHNNV